jgi:hypothetical protein
MAKIGILWLVSDNDEGAIVSQVGISYEVLHSLEDMAGDSFGRFCHMRLK